MKTLTELQEQYYEEFKGLPSYNALNSKQFIAVLTTFVLERFPLYFETIFPFL